MRSPSATATWRRGSRCGRKICRRRGTICNWPSSARRRAETRKPFAGRPTGSGCSRMHGRTSGSLFFAVDLLCKAGRRSDAEAQLWRCFEKAPSLELYARLRRLAGKTAHPQAVKLLQARLARETPTRWHSPADLLIRVHMQESIVRRGLGHGARARSVGRRQGGPGAGERDHASARGACGLCRARGPTRRSRRQSGLCGSGGADRPHGGAAQRGRAGRRMSRRCGRGSAASAIS